MLIFSLFQKKTCIYNSINLFNIPLKQNDKIGNGIKCSDYFRQKISRAIRLAGIPWQKPMAIMALH
jgi:hypothetical protein